MFSFIKSFKERGGFSIAGASLINKFVTVLLSIVVVRFFDKSTYGEISYARSIVTSLFPLAGLGVTFSLLRYGSLPQNNKKELYIYSIKRGSLFTCVLIISLMLLSPIIMRQIPSAIPYFIISAIAMLPEFLFQIKQSFLRANKDNRHFASSNIEYTILSAVLSVIAALFLGPKYYCMVFIIVPLIVFNKNKNIKYREMNNKYHDIPSGFNSYGLWVSVGALVYQVMLIMETIMLSVYVPSPETIAIYRVGAMIPVQMAIIPTIILTTDFVYVAEKSTDNVFLRKAALKYSLSLGALSLVIIFVLKILGQRVITILFSSEYDSSHLVMSILSISIFVDFAVKIPIGNMLNAMGKAKVSSVLVFILVFVSVAFNTILIPKFGIVGAAWASVSTNIVNAFLGLSVFIWFTKKTVKGKDEEKDVNSL